MPQLFSDLSISCFLLKVASRCNINCDYCYMYNHLDQSWKTQPKFMSDETMNTAANRIKQYVQTKNLNRIAIVYHGGEPLLMPVDKLILHANYLKELLPDTIIEFCLQTNGVLLKEADISKFSEAGIQISLSLDGPSTANDRHRLDHQGQSSFRSTERALAILEKNPKVFSGVIAVIDAKNDPKEILDYFAKWDIPQLDFLLPDANYCTVPPGISENDKQYITWLIDCFDHWFDYYPTMKIRTFDAVLASLLGVPSETDGFGLGDVSLITIETNGSYHDLDVLKITGEGTGLIDGDVVTHSIEEALNSEQVRRHRHLLSKEGLSLECQQCDVVDICGGGAVAHRFSENGFDNPSVYCRELKALITHAENRVMKQLQTELEKNEESNFFLPLDNLKIYENVGELNDVLAKVRDNFLQSQSTIFRRVIDNIHIPALLDSVIEIKSLSEKMLGEISIIPAVVTWTEVMDKDMSGIQTHDIAGQIIYPDPYYLKEVLEYLNQPKSWPRVQNSSFWLRAPFADKIYFESKEIADIGSSVLEKALKYISTWKPLIIKEMVSISPDIQYIRDPTAHPEKVVSFSDNSVPGALYVQLKRGSDFIEPEDLADSVIHEHRHQKLYMLQRVCPIVHSDFPLVASPWREELRPPTGLFHALFVFVELLDFWTFLSTNEEFNLKEKAFLETIRISDQLKKGFNVVESCDLTDHGKELLQLLKIRFNKLQYEDKAAL